MRVCRAMQIRSTGSSCPCFQTHRWLSKISAAASSSEATAGVAVRVDDQLAGVASSLLRRRAVRRPGRHWPVHTTSVHSFDQRCQGIVFANRNAIAHFDLFRTGFTFNPHVEKTRDPPIDMLLV